MLFGIDREIQMCTTLTLNNQDCLRFFTEAKKKKLWTFIWNILYEIHDLEIFLYRAM